jgi:ABC-2 type transport system ATP-binding protein
MASGITVQGLVKTYRRGKVKALAGVDMEFQPGKTHGLIGPNGSGKTTLLGCLLGLLQQDAGVIEIDGLSPDDLGYKGSLGYVPERLRFDMWMKAWDFMKYHYHLARLDPADRDNRITECLERVGLEPKHWKEPLKSYSRGMLQRVGIAQALLNRPKYLFLDEPTSGMDPAGVVLFRRIVREENERGCLILLSSHQLSQVEQLCDKVHFIEHGRFNESETKGADTTKRIMCLRWSHSLAGQGVPKELPVVQNARLIEQRASEVLFEVEGDQGASGIIEALVKAGYPLIEAIPDASRLERLFKTPKERTHD